MSTPTANTVQLPAGTWTIDPAATTATVTVKKLGFITVAADLKVVDGTIEIGTDNTVSSATVNLDAASYASANDKRNEHVVSGDFLDVENHPHLTFEASTVTATSGGYTASGQVTVKGRTTPVQIDISDVAVTGSAAAFVVSATLDRKEIGVDKMPAFVIGRKLQLDVAVTATAS